MTIHKSKGLEAAVVFVCGGFTRGSDGPHLYHDGDLRVLDLDPSDEWKKVAEGERAEEEQRLYYVALTRAKARLYLPLVPQQHWPSSWKGGYLRVNQRLQRVLERPEAAGLFTTRAFRDEPQDPGQTENLRPPRTWRPGRTELQIAGPACGFAALRERYRGYIVTSYSRMKQASTRGDTPIEPDEFYREPVPAIALDALPEGGLPGGRETGTLLHEILEDVPLDETAKAADRETWRTLGPVVRAVDAALTRSGIAHDHRREVEDIVHGALTCTIRGGGKTIRGLCRCAQALREMDFVFTIPETTHPRLAHPKAGSLRIERGFLKGFVDLVVEHEGLVFVVDWKSDVLASYDPEALATCVADHYDLQAKLYALALVKALGAHTEAAYKARFGGMFYIFLRTPRPGRRWGGNPLRPAACLARNSFV